MSYPIGSQIEKQKLKDGFRPPSFCKYKSCVYNSVVSTNKQITIFERTKGAARCQMQLVGLQDFK